MTPTLSLPSFKDDALVDLVDRLRNPMWVHGHTGAPRLDEETTQRDLAAAADLVDAVLRARSEAKDDSRVMNIGETDGPKTQNRVDHAYDTASTIAERHGNPEIAAEIAEAKGWDGLDCSCGGGWKVGHAYGCPEDAEGASAQDPSPPPIVTNDEKADAERWRAFIGSDRFTAMGWTSAFRIGSGAAPLVEIDPNHDDTRSWIHFTLNIWDQHPAGADAQGVHGRRMLLAYVDHLVDRERRRNDLPPVARRSSIPDAAYTVYVPAGWRLVPVKLTDTMCLHITMNDDPNIAWERAVEDAPNPPFANNQVDALQFRLDRGIEENGQQRKDHAAATLISTAALTVLTTATRETIEVLSRAPDKTDTHANAVAILREALADASPALPVASDEGRDHD